VANIARPAQALVKTLTGSSYIECDGRTLRVHVGSDSLAVTPRAIS